MLGLFYLILSMNKGYLSKEKDSTCSVAFIHWELYFQVKSFKVKLSNPWLLFYFFLREREFQPMTFALDNSLSSDQDTNQFLV